MTIRLEADERGDGTWRTLRDVPLEAAGYEWVELTDPAIWLRLRSSSPLAKATAWFQFSNLDPRNSEADPLFAGLAGPHDRTVTGGLVRARDQNKRTLSFSAVAAAPGGREDLGYYELDGDLHLRRVEDVAAHRFTQQNAAIPSGVLEVDGASVVFSDDTGRRWRLPKGAPALDGDGPLGPCRVDREVATERDLFNAHGTFYELPAENAGGFAKVRPVATHNRRIQDYCSYRGLLIISGIALDAAADNPHILRSDDGKTALWAGALDDVWALGKPRGVGGPWKDSPVSAGKPSDPYLLTGYDKKTLTLAHNAARPVAMQVDVDLTGTGVWKPYRTFVVAPGATERHEIPAAYNAYWLRVTSDLACTATAQLAYE